MKANPSTLQNRSAMWLWVAGAVGAASVGWWLWNKRAPISWTCSAGHECTKHKGGSWHDDDPVARVLKIYDDAPANFSALTVKRESPVGDYTVYELPAGKLSSQPHPVQSFLP